MPFTNATVDVQKMDLTPMQVTFQGTDIGGTLGNAVITFKYEKADIKADQFGTTPLDKRISGMLTTITTEFTQVQDMDKMKLLFPNLDLATSGPNKIVRMANRVGVSDYDSAGILTLHPLNKGPSDHSQDWTFLKAHPTEESEVVYGPTEQAKMKIVWTVFPDNSSASYAMWIHGDPSVGLIAASAGSAVPGSNTGNGTVSGIGVFSGSTKTETITMTVVGVPSSNHANFEVHGSLSGPLGIATLGVSFNSPEISFTINDGATDFVIGDSFTIATTAANYV